MFVESLGSIVVAVLLLGKLFRPNDFFDGKKLEAPSSGTLQARQTPEDISVLSWNILAPCYTRPHLFRSLKGLNDVDPEEYMDWSYRKLRIVDVLSQHQADVVCLQEVQLNLWPDFRESLQKIGYTTAVVQNVNRGLAVTTVVLLHDRRRQDWKVSKAESRSRVLLVTIECQTSDSKDPPYYLFVGNVHLQAGSRELATRYSQVKSLLKRLYMHTKRVSTTQTYRPSILLMGDWNTLRTDPLHALLSTGELPDGHGLPQLYPNLPLLPLDDVHEKLPGVEVPWTHSCGEILDYIFVSPHLEVREAWSHTISTPSALLIPNADFPSDHVPIGGVVRLKRGHCNESND